MSSKEEFRILSMYFYGSRYNSITKVTGHSKRRVKKLIQKLEATSNITKGNSYVR